MILITITISNYLRALMIFPSTRQDKTKLYSTKKYELDSFQLPYIIKQKTNAKIIIIKILNQLSNNNNYIYESIT